MADDDRDTAIVPQGIDEHLPRSRVDVIRGLVDGEQRRRLPQRVGYLGAFSLAVTQMMPALQVVILHAQAAF